MNQKEFISNYNFKFKKKYGQNFIIDNNILDNIIKYSMIDEGTLVIEIGCGAGALTSKVLEKTSNYIGYEIDLTLKPILDKFNVNIIYDDFLKRNIKKDIENYNYKKIYIISNLPYYITTPILNKIIKDGIDVDKMVIMVQKEVGDRFSAKPNTKDYNSLTVFINYYFDVNKLFVVSKNVFIPKPNVDSIVLSLSKKSIRKKANNEEVFFKLVRDSFVQKRKTLHNNLKDYDFDVIKKILNRNGFDENVRAEAIPLEVFIDISNEL